MPQTQALNEIREWIRSKRQLLNSMSTLLEPISNDWEFKLPGGIVIAMTDIQKTQVIQTIDEAIAVFTQQAQVVPHTSELLIADPVEVEPAEPEEPAEPQAPDAP